MPNNPYAPGGQPGQQSPYGPGGQPGQQSPYGPGGQPGQQSPYAPPGAHQPPPGYGPAAGYYPPPGLKPHRGNAVLTLGILGLVVCTICGIIAWVMGNNDLKEMKAGVMDPSGYGLTNAGRICGMVGTILAAVAIVVYVVIVVALIGSGGFDS